MIKRFLQAWKINLICILGVGLLSMALPPRAYEAGEISLGSVFLKGLVSGTVVMLFLSLIMRPKEKQ
jgi:xanthine/uracil permease